MNVKIQGGGSGKYANTGSSFGAMQYLNHENEENLSKKGQIEPFFDHKGENVDFAIAVDKLDRNKGQLGRNTPKFFAVTISPSEKELSQMGNTEAERSKAMKAYTRKVMDEYAKNFKKGLTGDDLLYYAKIHHNRGSEEGMHAHVIVSRKDIDNRRKLSSMTNHPDAERSGNVKSGYNRSDFYEKCEDEFDKQFKYERQYTESYKYCNAMKNGTFQEKLEVVNQSERTPIKPLLQDLQIEEIKERQRLDQERSQANQLSRDKDQSKGYGFSL